MPYSYEIERPKLLTDEGQRDILKLLRAANRLLDESGAVRADALLGVVGKDTWYAFACIDRLVEIGALIEAKLAEEPFSQHRIYVGGPAR